MIFQDIDLEQIKDFEDVAVGAGILSHNAHMFDDGAQVQCPQKHSTKHFCRILSYVNASTDRLAQTPRTFLLRWSSHFASSTSACSSVIGVTVLNEVSYNQLISCTESRARLSRWYRCEYWRRVSTDARTMLHYG